MLARSSSLFDPTSAIWPMTTAFLGFHTGYVIVWLALLFSFFAFWDFSCLEGLISCEQMGMGISICTSEWRRRRRRLAGWLASLLGNFRAIFTDGVSGSSCSKAVPGVVGCSESVARGQADQ